MQKEQESGYGKRVKDRPGGTEKVEAGVRDVRGGRMKLASLFDGIGGALLCAKRCGIEAVWSSEIEPFPIKVTEYHFPNVKHLGDITKIKGDQVEPVDIIIGGSPCQDLSVAGLRKGMKHSDFGDEETTRSGLFMEQIRIVKEMRNATGTTYPRFMVWENVPGAFSSKGAGDQLEAGDAFRIVLEETARVSDSTISIPRSPGGWANSGSILGDGFSISWRTIDAQYFGVPQRRRRIYLVADFGGQSAPKILFEREGNKGNNNPIKKREKGNAKNVFNVYGESICGTLMARDYKGAGRKDTWDRLIFQDGKVRNMTPTERERAQGYPDNYTKISGATDASRTKGLGNSFATLCAEFVIRGIKEADDATRE